MIELLYLVLDFIGVIIAGLVGVEPVKRSAVKAK